MANGAVRQKLPCWYHPPLVTVVKWAQRGQSWVVQHFVHGLSQGSPPALLHFQGQQQDLPLADTHRHMPLADTHRYIAVSGPLACWELLGHSAFTVDFLKNSW